MKEKTLFEEIRERRIPYSHYESDLYIPITPETRALMDDPMFETHRVNRKAFNNRRLGGALWWDVPFAYDPWWEARIQKGGE